MSTNPRELPPPHDLDAEGAVLSAVMLEPETLYRVQDTLRSDDFFALQNQTVFGAIEALDRAGSKVDAVSIARQLKNTGQLNVAGGIPYLTRLTDCTPAVTHIEEHARIVREEAFKRRLIRALQDKAAEGYGAIESAERWGQEVEAAVYRAARWGASDATDNTMRAVIPEVLDEVKRRSKSGELAGMSTGWPEIDRRLGGWRKKVYVIAGRPGMGKSAFAAQACAQVAETGKAAILVSLEMDRDELAMRLIANYARMPYTAIESGRIGNRWDEVAVAASTLNRLPLSIVKAHGATVTRIRTIVRQEMARLRAHHGEALELGAIAVDYLQLVDSERQKGESRDGEVSRICRELQWLTGEFDCALLEVSQLNRTVESRGDKRPMLSDLRESGAIEQEAYAVLFPFREAYYSAEKRADRMQECELIVAKHRNGPGPTIPMMFTADAMRFDVLVDESRQFDDIADNHEERYR